MSEAEIRAIALFFFFALLDENKALEAANRALLKFQHLQSKHKEMKSSQAIVAASYSVWLGIRKNLERGKHNFSHESTWFFSKDLDLDPWKEFQKQAPENELLIVIWVHILGISIDDVSRALGLASGTLRYRAGRGLARLGEYAQPLAGKSSPVLGIVSDGP